MLSGISTACFYPALLERAMAFIAQSGVEATEVFINAPSELQDDYLRELRRIADSGGTRVVSIHPFTSGLEPLLFFSDYSRRFADGIELYKHYFHAANLLGAELLVFHGDYRQSGRSRTRYFDLFGKLAEMGRQMGVTVAQENVPRCVGWCPEFFIQMAETLPDARFVLDVKQSLRAGIPVETMIDAMGTRVAHVHISDHKEEKDCLPVGQGVMDLPGLLTRLRGNGFDGAVLLEVYQDSYSDWSELTQSCELIAAAVQRKN